MTDLEIQLSSLSKVRATNIEDSAKQIVYLVNDAQYDKAAAYCQYHKRLLDELAGALSQLIPVTPSKPDKLPEPRSPYDGTEVLINACRKCGSDAKLFEQMLLPAGSGKSEYYCHCSICINTGPKCAEKNQAIEEWNAKNRRK